MKYEFDHDMILIHEVMSTEYFMIRYNFDSLGSKPIFKDMVKFLLTQYNFDPEGDGTA